jgi:hypothetical protein
VTVKSWQLLTFFCRSKSQPIRVMGGKRLGRARPRARIHSTRLLLRLTHGVTHPLWYAHGMWQVVFSIR